MNATTIAQALAARFIAPALTAPAGYDNVRSSTEQLPDQLGPTPCVLVFPGGGPFDTGTGERLGEQRWKVRFYYDQFGDLPRSSTALLAWITVLVDQLKGATQLAGVVTRATVDGWTAGVLRYAEQSFTGVELDVTTITTEAWDATA